MNNFTLINLILGLSEPFNPFYKDKETNFKQVFEMVEQHSKKYIKAAFL